MPMSSVRGIIEAEQEFLDFFALVQKEASKLGKVFFIADAERRDQVLDGLYCSEMSGWLVPPEEADAFEERWREHDPALWKNGTGGEYFVWEDFVVEPDGSITITFEDHGQDQVFDL